MQAQSRRAAAPGRVQQQQQQRQLLCGGRSFAACTVPRASSKGHASPLTGTDLSRLVEASQLSQSLVGVTAPHPNAACLLVSPDGRLLASGVQRAQGTTPAEVLAVRQAREAARGATAYLNLESGDCHGDESAVAALVGAGVSRVVVGLRHPLRHLRGKALGAYASAGLDVAELLGAGSASAGGLARGTDEDAAAAAAAAVLAANEALLHRAALRRPLSVLKYAMTLDGKIATAAGHSAWVSSPASRARVFAARAASDAVVVGGNTVRRDNPRLTTRQEGGHLPARLVMSRTLELPESANLWDTQEAPTIVMTQRGARGAFQARLRARGVEVVEFDFLTPDHVAAYCYERGFLQVFWECGGTLAAPAIAGGVIHKVLAFIAPKIIGGARAPTPVGELGNVEMTQALSLLEPHWEGVGPDVLMTGFLPSSGGPAALERCLAFPPGSRAAAAAVAAAAGGGAGASSSSSSSSRPSSSSGSASSSTDCAGQLQGGSSGRVVSFYKAWDEWGCLSNFSPHPIAMPPGRSGGDGGASSSSSSASSSASSAVVWASVEHFYQAQKFAGVDSDDARALVAAIANAPSPEEAAALGRRAERGTPALVRPDWESAKRHVMLAALRAKFRAHAGPRAMLLSTAAAGGAQQQQQQEAVQHAAQQQPGWSLGPAPGASGDALLVESSPHDRYWGLGYDGRGHNHLGQLLMQVRTELLQEQQQQQQQGEQQHGMLAQQQGAAAPPLGHQLNGSAAAAGSLQRDAEPLAS